MDACEKVSVMAPKREAVDSNFPTCASRLAPKLPAEQVTKDLAMHEKRQHI